MQFLLFVCFIGLSLAHTGNGSPPIVEIRNGKIRGRTVTSLQNKTIYLFLEIPYGQPPVGNLRLKDPLPAKNWTGVLNTTVNTKICFEQRTGKYDRDDYRRNEDCLYLNVFSPISPGPRKLLLPVFVYVYGGQYLAGEATYGKVDPQLFVDSGVIVVTFNFRSGALGFLTTEDGVISANRGLKDQHLALQWVQENIHFFGGDPDKVTLGGQSSGAMCVAYQVLSSKTTGLFRAAIIQSGTQLSPLGYTQRARKFAFEMGKQLSPKFSYENSSEDLLKLLLEVPAKTITDMDFPHLLVENNALEKEFEKMYWRPIIEKSDIPNAYITKLPHDSLLTGQFQKVPLLTGITSEEYMHFKNLPLAAEISQGSVLFENDNVKWGFRNSLEDEIKRLYDFHMFQENPYAVIKYISDYIFSIATIRFAELHARHSNVYFYKFSYLGKINELAWTHATNIEGLGSVSHAQELPYLLYHYGKPAEYHKFPESDLVTQKRLIKLWTNFIKYMNPTPEPEHLTEYIKWPALQKGFTYLDINTNLTVVNDIPRQLYLEWVKMIDKYYRHPLGML